MTLDQFTSLSEAMEVYALNHALHGSICTMSLLAHCLRYSGTEKGHIVKATISISCKAGELPDINYRCALGAKQSISVEDMVQLLVETK